MKHTRSLVQRSNVWNPWVTWSNVQMFEAHELSDPTFKFRSTCGPTLYCLRYLKLQVLWSWFMVLNTGEIVQVLWPYVTYNLSYKTFDLFLEWSQNLSNLIFDLELILKRTKYLNTDMKNSCPLENWKVLGFYWTTIIWDVEEIWDYSTRSRGIFSLTRDIN